MPRYGFVVNFEARPGQEEAVRQFLVDAKPMVDAEPGTFAWFSFQSGPSTFGIFDAFETEADREFHLNGEVRKTIDRRNDELFASAPTITPVDLIATKLPL